MSAKLLVTETIIWLTGHTVSGYALIWFSDGEEGMRLGEDWEVLSSVTKEEWNAMTRMVMNDSANEDRTEDWICAHTAFSFSPDYTNPFFLWETKGRATQALQAVKVALKAYQESRPVPEWAQVALAHGWKPPKNWQL